MPEQPLPAHPVPASGPVPQSRAQVVASGGSLPTSLPRLREQLAEIVALSSSYCAQHPESAAAGGWWRENPPIRPGGPQHPGHSGKSGIRQPREAAVLLLFWIRDSRLWTVLTQRGADLAHHPSQVAFPGGGVEPQDQGRAQTALREAYEEISLDPQRVEVIGELAPAPVPISGYVVTPVLAVTEDPGRLYPQIGEVARVVPVALTDLLRPRNRSQVRLSERPGGVATPGFEVADVLIWGFTGILLDRVTQRLGWAQPWDRSRAISPW